MSEMREIARRTGVVGFFTFLSRILGLVRDMAIAHAFGTWAQADAFFVAFRIPNLLRRLFAEGALTVSFVPIFSESLKKSEPESKGVVDTSFSLMVVVVALVSLLGIVFSPLFVQLTAWGFSRDPEKFALTVSLTRIMFPYLLLVSLAALAMGILNSVKHFAVPAAAPIFMNLGIIAGALLFTGWVEPPVLGLAAGVLVGGLFQLGIHIPHLKKYGYLPRWRWNPQHPAVKKIVGMMMPAAYGAAVYQFNVIIITLLASFLPSGSVSYLWYADRVMEFPLGIFAISLATVILPTLSDHAASGRIEDLKKTFAFGLRMIFFVTVPAACGLVVLSQPIIRLLFEHGSFGTVSTEETASALIYFSIGLPFISAVRVTSNAFYALQDSRIPVRSANGSVLVNLVLSLFLMGPMAHSGLALAVSLAAVFNFVFQLRMLWKKVGNLPLRPVFESLLKVLLASAVMSGTLIGAGAVEGLPVLLAIPLGAGVYFAACWLLRMEEVKGFTKLLRTSASPSNTPEKPSTGGGTPGP